MVIERLDGTYESTNDVGQYPMYNKVAGVVVTGNEDGAHAAAETTLFNLSHLGFTIPPNADTYWVGDAGPGPSFIEANGKDHPYTQKTAGWMAHNVVHMARILRGAPDSAGGEHGAHEARAVSRGRRRGHSAGRLPRRGGVGLRRPRLCLDGCAQGRPRGKRDLDDLPLTRLLLRAP